MEMFKNELIQISDKVLECKNALDTLRIKLSKEKICSRQKSDVNANTDDSDSDSDHVNPKFNPEYDSDGKFHKRNVFPVEHLNPDLNIKKKPSFFDSDSDSDPDSRHPNKQKYLNGYDSDPDKVVKATAPAVKFVPEVKATATGHLEFLGRGGIQIKNKSISRSNSHKSKFLPITKRKLWRKTKKAY